MAWQVYGALSIIILRLNESLESREQSCGQTGLGTSHLHPSVLNVTIVCCSLGEEKQVALLNR